ncbi:hypothetical protein D9M70_623210 [compost metagenome]
MLAREDHRPGGRTDGVGDAGIGKEHPVSGDPVNVRRLGKFRVIGGDGLVGVII